MNEEVNCNETCEEVSCQSELKYGESAIASFDVQKDLEVWENSSKRDYMIKITLPEFCCLCPRSGYPDFATIHLEYIPNKYVVELKAIKLYINSFISRHISHEESINEIYEVLEKKLAPKYIKIVGDFNARGNVHTVIEINSELIEARKRVEEKRELNSEKKFDSKPRFEKKFDKFEKSDRPRRSDRSDRSEFRPKFEKKFDSKPRFEKKFDKFEKSDRPRRSDKDGENGGGEKRSYKPREPFYGSKKIQDKKPYVVKK